MRAIGIILAGGNSSRMGELSAKRAVAAMPIVGSYRAIDFTLSNMTNSHIQKVAVYTQYNSRSLNEHLNSSKWWDFGRKQGGLYLFTPTITATNSYWYKGTADALYQNISFLKSAHEPYVVIASGDAVYKLDYNKVLEEHIATGADITVVCKDIQPGEDDINRFGVVKLADDNRVISFEEKPIVAETNTASIGVYVVRRRQLIELLEACAAEGRSDFVNDILVRYKVEDLPPAKYNGDAAVSNSLIASGSIINGTVEDSVLFKKVYIGNNCVIKNSIILNDVHIGDNCYIENCIVESRDTLRANTVHTGDPNEIKVIVEKNFRYAL